MSFNTYRKKVDNLWVEHLNNIGGHSTQQERDRFYQNYIGYSNKQLVWATWALAIGTLILSGLTLYLTFSTRAT